MKEHTKEYSVLVKRKHQFLESIKNKLSISQRNIKSEIIMIDKQLEKIEEEGKQIIEDDNESKNHLNHKYIFGNFIKGESNKLAYNVAKDISKQPLNSNYNPLYIYGGVGSGKTHLIQAIGNKIIEKDSTQNVIYITSEQFTIEFIDAIQSGNANEFSSFYKNVDVLIIDDIQFLAGKPKTQEYFFHIFDDLYENGKLIILSAHKQPTKIKGLDKRLVSRFEGGTKLKLKAPNLSMRIDILEMNANKFGVEIPIETKDYIAKKITTARGLEGCMMKLLASSSIYSDELNVDLFKEIMGEIN